MNTECIGGYDKKAYMFHKYQISEKTKSIKKRKINYQN